MISHGGSGISSLSALEGKRQVMIPTQIEQRMLARRLVQQGLAYAVDPTESEPDFQNVFEQALSCKTLGRNISLLRMQYRDFSQAEQLDVMTEKLLSLVFC